MLHPALPADEQQRLEALAELGLVDSPAEERFDRITELAQQVLDVPVALVSLVSADRQWFKSLRGLNIRETPRELSFCAHAILQKDLLVVPDARLDPAFADNPLVTGAPAIRFYAGCPVHYRGQPIGTLCVIDRQPRVLEAGQRRALQNLAAIVESEFRLQALSADQHALLAELDETRRQALLDYLTGTWNRRGIDEIVPRELSRAARANDAVAIMLIDIDHFKRINDTLGHHAGDVTLQEVARRLRRCIRPHDVIGRYGGDEFLIFLGQCGREDAERIGKRMLESVHDSPIETPAGTATTGISIGLYSMQEIAGRSLGQIVEAADQALYRAKDLGRNQLVHY
jgi:diguanylate cyclase (GGDEF)-like protein